MKEDWDKLAAAFAKHPIALIAEVDCTADEGLPICNDFDVQVCVYICVETLFLCVCLCLLWLCLAAPSCVIPPTNDSNLDTAAAAAATATNVENLLRVFRH
jgi:hypothetical protein